MLGFADALLVPLDAVVELPEVPLLVPLEELPLAEEPLLPEELPAVEVPVEEPELLPEVFVVFLLAPAFALAFVLAPP